MSCTTCAGAIGRLARTQGADSHHAPLSIRDPGREGVFRRHPGRKGRAGHAQAGPPHPLRARRRISTPRSLWTPIRKPLSLCSRRSRLACRYRACNAAAARMWRTSWMCSAVALQRKKPHQLLRRRKGVSGLRDKARCCFPSRTRRASKPQQSSRASKRPSGKGRLTRAEISKTRQRCRSE